MQDTAVKIRNLSLGRYRDTVGRLVEGLVSYSQEEIIAILELALAEVRLQVIQSRRIVNETGEQDWQQDVFREPSGRNTNRV
jgi:hypothetical protein